MSPESRGFRLCEIVERFGGELLGDGGVVLTQVASLDRAGPSHLAFLARDAHRRSLLDTGAGAVIVGDDSRDATSIPRIVTANPLAYFARVSTLFNPARDVEPGVHPSAFVARDARVDPGASIGAFAVIEADAVIGAGVEIGHRCHVGRAVRVGDGTRMYPNVTLYDHCIVGRRALLHSGCVIGADGFGGAREQGRWIKIPQIGRVVLGDDVEVGANTAIDRGTMNDTVIEDGVKLDNLIQVGHNCRIGAHTAIAGCAGIAGSATIGSRCIIGGGAIVLGHLVIADDVEISAGTIITRSISRAGRYSGIYPFTDHRAWLRAAVRLRRLGATEADPAPALDRRLTRRKKKP